MRDRKEYYKNYNKKCKFINLRFNMQDEEEKALYEAIIENAWCFGWSCSRYVKFCVDRFMEKY